jgi:hypothetical protein
MRVGLQGQIGSLVGRALHRSQAFLVLHPGGNVVGLVWHRGKGKSSAHGRDE